VDELAATLAARSFLHNIVVGAILKDQSSILSKPKAKAPDVVVHTALHRSKTLTTPRLSRSLLDDAPRSGSRSPFRASISPNASREASPEEPEKRRKSKLTAPSARIHVRNSFSAADRQRAASFLLPRDGPEARRLSVARGGSARNSTCATPSGMKKNLHQALSPQLLARRLSQKLRRSASVTTVPVIKAQKVDKDKEADSESNSEGEQAPEVRRKRGKSPKPHDSNEPKADAVKDGDAEASATAVAETGPAAEAESAEAVRQWPLLTQPQALPVGGPFCITLDAGALSAAHLGGLCLEAEVPSMVAGLLGFPQFQHQLYAPPAQIRGDTCSLPSAMGPLDYWGASVKSGSEERADMSVPAYGSPGESNSGWDWADSQEADGFEQDVAFPSSSPGVLPTAATPQGLAPTSSAPGSADAAKKDTSPSTECSPASAAERASVAPHMMQGAKPPPGPCTTKGRPKPQLAGRPAKSASGAPDKRGQPLKARAGKTASAAGRPVGGGAEKEAPQASDQVAERQPAKNTQLSPVRRRRPQPQALAPVNEDVFIYTLTPSVDRGTAPSKLAPAAVLPMADAGENDIDTAGFMDLGVEADGTSHPGFRSTMARNRSFKLLANLDSGSAEYRPSSSGRPRKTPRPWTEPVVGATPRKGALAPLNPHDSTRSLATVQTVSTTAGTNSLTSQTSSQKLLKGTPGENTRLAQRARLRERGWDASFATRAGSGILSHSSLGSLDSDDGDWPGWVSNRRANTAPSGNRNLVTGDILTYSESEELAANWALALVTGSPSRPTTGPASMSRPGTGGLGATELPTGDMSPLAYHSSRDCLPQEYVEWNGSHLHEQYMTSLREKLQDAAKDDAMASGAASLRATQVQLEQPHMELRSLLRGLADGTADLGMNWATSCQKHVEVLWEELQVSSKARRPAAKRSYAGQSDEDMARATGEHAQELLSYRDATVRILSGLVERDHLIAVLGKDSGIFPADDAYVNHLAEIDTALAKGLVGWCLNFGHFAQLGDPANRPRAQQMGKRAVFLWCGQDALEVIRSSAARVGTASSSTSQLTSGLGKASPFLGIMPVEQKPNNFRMPGFRCQQRAARSGNRALRALLRGGGHGGRPLGLSPQGWRPNTSPWTGNC